MITGDDNDIDNDDYNDNHLPPSTRDLETTLALATMSAPRTWLGVLERYSFNIRFDNFSVMFWVINE